VANIEVNMKRKLTEEEIDNIVEEQADDYSKWNKPIKVKKDKNSTINLPNELVQRAKFLAKLHKENSVDDWIKKVLKEKIELEEQAYKEAKRELLKNSA
jgi:hypothetical protein